MMEQHQPKPSPSHTAPISEAFVTAASVVKSSEEEHSEIVVAPTPISSSDGGGEPTSPIFHVLLLPGGNIQKLDSDGDAASNSDNTSGKGGPAVIIDDYLYQRHVYRRKKLKKLQPQNNQRGGNTDNNHNNGNSDDNGREISLKELASPLEIALASCCVHPNNSSKQSAEEGGGQNQQQNEGTSQQQTQRSRLHRPILPSNADDDDDNNELLDTPRNIPMRDTTTTDHDNNKKKDGEVGTLQHGRETHFLKLLQMYCHSTKDLLMCRALAVQILQRTVDWEKKSGSGNPATVDSSGEGEEKQPNDDHRVADDSSAAAAVEPPANDSSSSSTTTSTKQRKNHTVMKTFLAIGGMKLLARWLVESYTVLHPQSSPTSSSSNKKKQQQQHPNTATVLPSVTGSLLLPLLTLLKSIPFNKEIIVASQIHKYIKRYKKALMTVMSSNKSMMMSDVDGVEIVHPIAGGGSVNQVMNAVDEVMNEWNNATKNSTGDNDNDETKEDKVIDPYKSLRDQLQSRFDELAAFHNHRTNPPEWIPKAVLGVVMASPSPNLSSSPTSTSPTNNNSSAPAATMKPNPALATKNNANNEWGTNRASASQIARERFLEGFRKQKEAVASSSSSSSSGLSTMPPEKRQKVANSTAGGDAVSNSASSNKKVCWVDRPGRKGVSPQPLHIERVFVKEDEYVAGSGSNEVEDVDVEMFGEEEESDENGLGGEGLPILRQQQQQDDTMTAGEDDVVMTEETDTKDDEVDSDLDDMF